MMNADRKTIIEMKGISKYYPGVTALDHVDLDIIEGEVHALAGKNGAGKSTLIKILGGATRPDTGEIFLNGNKVTLHSPHDSIAAGIAIISQELMLVPELSVTENIMVGRLPRTKFGTVDWQSARQSASEALSQLGIDLDLNVPVKKLSTAQQQAVEIAKALSRNAKVLVMDEPTSSLPNKEVDHLLDTIRRLSSRGISIIYITHKLKEIFAVSDRITVLRDGKLIQTSPINEINDSKVVELMVGKSADAMFIKGPSSIQNAPVLEVKNLTREGSFSDISFTLKKGEILGIAGLLGSGRTEILRSIFGVDPADSGEIIVDGRKIENPSVTGMISNGVSLAPEDRKLQGLVLSMNISDNINMASLHSALRHLSEEKKISKDLFGRMGVKAPSIKTLVSSLSGGNQQKIVISKWLATDPKVVLLDEPTRGIDVGAKADIYRLVEQLAAKGVGVIMVSSEFPELLSVCDRIIVLHEGRQDAEFLYGEADEETLMAYASGTDNTRSDREVTHG